jgi:hypothetical protein
MVLHLSRQSFGPQRPSPALNLHTERRLARLRAHPWTEYWTSPQSVTTDAVRAVASA